VRCGAAQRVCDPQRIAILEASIGSFTALFFFFAVLPTTADKAKKAYCGTAEGAVKSAKEK
jgi:hypothetical protein